MAGPIQATIARLTPRWISRWRSERRHARAVRLRMERDRLRSAADVFTDIYLSGAWGGGAGDYFSGTGSVGRAADGYVRMINQFIREQRISCVVDIGCGDYRIGSRLEAPRYVGLDVVQVVIDRNNRQYASETVSFECVDVIAHDDLPAGDLCLVRQVLQHLSNEQIALILTKLDGYRHVIITEHYPSEEDFVCSNADLVHGRYTRVLFGSGVYLDRPPIDLLLEVAGDDDASGRHHRGSIRSYLLSRESRR